MAPLQNAADLLRGMTCPACGHHVAVPLFRSEVAPAIDVVRCVDCGHGFNAAAVASADPTQRTLNGGPGWPEHVRAVRDEMLGRLPASPVVIEVGHGNGDFLTALADARPAGRYVGFDPHGASESSQAAVELRRDHFVAARALAELSPHLIVNRYVLEYLAHPLGFIQEFGFAAAWSGIQPVLYLEVPCIDRALEKGRTFHFDHRHTSYFTTASFMKMLSRCGPVEQRIGHGYHGEVVYAFVRLGRGQAQVQHARAAEAFRGEAAESLARLRRQLDALATSGRSVAIWGGTGAAAGFIAQAGMDPRRFPIVIDSDTAAIGTTVPGTGQEIRSPEWLQRHPVDVVIIAMHRRAHEIAREMTAAGVRCETILIEDRGRLIDYSVEARDGMLRDACERVPALAAR